MSSRVPRRPCTIESARIARRKREEIQLLAGLAGPGLPRSSGFKIRKSRRYAGVCLDYARYGETIYNIRDRAS